MEPYNGITQELDSPGGVYWRKPAEYNDTHHKTDELIIQADAWEETRAED